MTEKFQPKNELETRRLARARELSQQFRREAEELADSFGVPRGHEYAIWAAIRKARSAKAESDNPITPQPLPPVDKPNL